MSSAIGFNLDQSKILSSGNVNFLPEDENTESALLQTTVCCINDANCT